MLRYHHNSMFTYFGGWIFRGERIWEKVRTNELHTKFIQNTFRNSLLLLLSRDEQLLENLYLYNGFVSDYLFYEWIILIVDSSKTDWLAHEFYIH